MSSLEEEEEDSCLLEAGSSTLNYPFNGREKSLNLRSSSFFSSSSSSFFILHVQKRTLVLVTLRASLRFFPRFISGNNKICVPRFLQSCDLPSILDINRCGSKKMKNGKKKLPIRRGIVSQRKRRGTRSCFLIVVTLMSGNSSMMTRGQQVDRAGKKFARYNATFLLHADRRNVCTFLTYWRLTRKHLVYRDVNQIKFE